MHLATTLINVSDVPHHIHPLPDCRLLSCQPLENEVDINARVDVDAVGRRLAPVVVLQRQITNSHVVSSDAVE